MLPGLWLVAVLAVTSGALSPTLTPFGSVQAQTAAVSRGAPPAAADIERQYRSGDTHAALERLDAALAADPGRAPLRFLKAVLSEEQGQLTQAAELYERMIEDFPDLPEPYNNLAALRASQGQLDTAHRLLEVALRLDPDYLTAQQNLGDVYASLALRAYTSAARNDKAEPALLRKLQQARQLVQQH